MTTVPQYCTLSVSQEHPRKDVPVNNIERRYTEIVTGWTSHLQYTSWQVTRDRQVAEDVVQEAFMALWQQKEKIMSENPVGWLIKVVTNLSARYLRDRNIVIKNHNSISHIKPAYCSDVEEQLLHKEQHLLLRNILKRLPEQQKLVFHLSKEKGLKRSQIASYLQLSPNTVKVHLARATQFMKEHLPFMSLLLMLVISFNFYFEGSNTIREEVEYFIKKTKETQRGEQISKISELSQLNTDKQF